MGRGVPEKPVLKGQRVEEVHVVGDREYRISSLRSVEEAKEIKDLFSKVYEGTYPYKMDEEKILEDHRSGKAHYLVVKHRGRVVGVGALVVKEDGKGRRYVELGRTVVDPNHRGLGIQKALLKVRADLAEELMRRGEIMGYFTTPRVSEPATLLNTISEIVDRRGGEVYGILPGIVPLYDAYETLAVVGKVRGKLRRRVSRAVARLLGRKERTVHVEVKENGWVRVDPGDGVPVAEIPRELADALGLDFSGRIVVRRVDVPLLLGDVVDRKRANRKLGRRGRKGLDMVMKAFAGIIRLSLKRKLEMV